MNNNGDINKVPDGSYRVVVTDAELTQSGAALMWTLEITSGPFANQLLRHYAPITPRAMDFLERELRLCGVVCAFSDLPAHLHELLGVQLEISRKTKGKYVNIYLIRRIETAAANDGRR